MKLCDCVVSSLLSSGLAGIRLAFASQRHTAPPVHEHIVMNPNAPSRFPQPMMGNVLWPLPSNVYCFPKSLRRSYWDADVTEGTVLIDKEAAGASCAVD